MTRRELMNLPCNRTFELTDGIYSYVLRKYESVEDGITTIIYAFRIKGSLTHSGQSFILTEETEVGEDRDYKKLIQTISVGGFSAHSEINYWQLGKLNIVNENSIKEWFKKMKVNDLFITILKL